MDDRDGCGEQISARQQQQRPRPQQAELRNSRMAVISSLMAARIDNCNERRNRRKRYQWQRPRHRQTEIDETPTTARAVMRSRFVAGKVTGRCCGRHPSALMISCSWHRMHRKGPNQTCIQ